MTALCKAYDDPTAAEGGSARPVTGEASVVGGEEAIGIDGEFDALGDGSGGDANRRQRGSRTARVRAMFAAIRKIQLFSDERPSKRSSAFRTPSHVSCTTSSAAARLET